MPAQDLAPLVPKHMVAKAIDLPLALERSVVYRAYDERGKILYVGVTDCIHARLGQHKANSPWWPDLHSMKIEVYDERRVAEARELDLITELDPPFNSSGRTWVSKQDQVKPIRRPCRNSFTGCKNNAMQSEAYCRRCWLKPFKGEAPGEPALRLEWEARQPAVYFAADDYR